MCPFSLNMLQVALGAWRVMNSKYSRTNSAILVMAERHRVSYETAFGSFTYTIAYRYVLFACGLSGSKTSVGCLTHA